jgi:hypothetical protein
MRSFIIFSSHKIDLLLLDQIKEDAMDRAHSMFGGEEKCQKKIVWKITRKETT